MQAVRDLIPRYPSLIVLPKPMSASKKREIPWSALAIVTTIILSAIAATHVIDNEISGIGTRVTGTEQAIQNAHLGDMGTRITKLESAVKALADEQSKKTQQLVHDILAVNQEQNRLKDQLRKDEAISEVKKDPETTLEAMRNEIQVALSTGEEIPDTKLAKFKLATLGLSPSATHYWKTAAAIINYESIQLQLKGLAPAPAEVSGPCALLTTNPFAASHDNAWMGMTIHNCIADIDTHTFIDVIFKDSVIRYKGGSVNLSNVQFVNCKFELNIPPDTPTSFPLAAPERRLLLALLNAPKLNDVRGVSTH